MSADPLRHHQTPASEPAGGTPSAAEQAGVTYLETGREHRTELEALRTRLEIEESAGRAMLVAVLELERRLDAERSKGRALLTSVQQLERRVDEQRRSMGGLEGSLDEAHRASRELQDCLDAERRAASELQGSLDEERRARRQARVDKERLWGDIHQLESELRDAERPLWRKLLRRG